MCVAVAVAIAVLKKEDLGDLEGGLALVREAVEAARRNPDVRAETREKYAEGLQKWEATQAALAAAGVAFNPESPWVMLTHGGEALYGNVNTMMDSRTKPAEGVWEVDPLDAATFAQYLKKAEMEDRITLLADGKPVPCTFGFGPAAPLEYSGAIVATDPARAEAPLTNAAGLRGKLALTVRGECAFAEKAERAAEAGAVAVIVVNSEPGDVTCAPGDPDNKYRGSVPVLGVSAGVGERLGAAAECCLHIEEGFAEAEATQTALAAAGVALSPESPWVMLTHGGEALYGNMITKTVARAEPAEGVCNVEPVDAATFAQHIESAEKQVRVAMARYYADGAEEPQLCDFYAKAEATQAALEAAGVALNHESPWVMLTHNGETLYVNIIDDMNTRTESRTKPAEGVLNVQPVDAATFAQYLEEAEALQATQAAVAAAGVALNPESPWVMLMHGREALYGNMTTRTKSRTKPAEGVCSVQPLDAATFAQMLEQVEATQAAVVAAGVALNHESPWVMLTHGGRAVYTNSNAFSQQQQPAEGVCHVEPVVAATFALLLGQAEKAEATQAALAAAGVALNAESPWIMLTHDGHAVYFEVDSDASSEQLPVEGVCNVEPVDAATFAQHIESAEKQVRVAMARYYADGAEEPQLCDFYAKAEATQAALEAAGVALNHESPWTMATNSGRCYYWRNAQFHSSLQAPAEGVKIVLPLDDEEFEGGFAEAEALQATLEAAGVALNHESPWVMLTHNGETLYLNMNTRTESRTKPAEGVLNVQPVDAATFAPCLENVEALQVALDAAGVVLNPESPWVMATNGGRCYYWHRDDPSHSSLQPPAGGVKTVQVEDDAEFEEGFARANTEPESDTETTQAANAGQAAGGAALSHRQQRRGGGGWCCASPTESP
eukprot:COSAG06_NODE_394_length_16313_cov_11.756568_6_plen_897_part_00